MIKNKKQKGGSDTATEMPGGKTQWTYQEIVMSLKYDEFSKKIFKVGKLPWRTADYTPWNENDDKQFYTRVKRGIIAPPDGLRRSSSKELLLDTIHCDVVEHKRINVAQLRYQMAEWDGTERLETLLVDYLGAEDTLYNRLVTKKWMVASAARSFKPGCKFDYMMVAYGRPGIGKTTFIQKLGSVPAGFPYQYSRFYSNGISKLSKMSGKTPREYMRGTSFVNIDEMGHWLNDLNYNDIKTFITDTEDEYRVPYHEEVQKFLRTAVIYGSTNTEPASYKIASDRRMWIVKVGVRKPTKSVHTDLEKELAQILAEALHWYRQGYNYWDAPEMPELAPMSENHPLSVLMKFLDVPLPVYYGRMSAPEATNYFNQSMTGNAPIDKKNLENRRFFTVPELIRLAPRHLEEFVDKLRKSCPRDYEQMAEPDGGLNSCKLSRYISNLMRLIPEWEGGYANIDTPLGKQRGFRRRASRQAA